MIPYTNDQGLRDYRPAAWRPPVPARRWPWLVLVLLIVAGAGVFLGTWR